MWLSASSSVGETRREARCTLNRFATSSATSLAIAAEVRDTPAAGVGIGAAICATAIVGGFVGFSGVTEAILRFLT